MQNSLGNVPVSLLLSGFIHIYSHWFHMEPLRWLPPKIHSCANISWIYYLDYKFKVMKRDCIIQHVTFRHWQGVHQYQSLLSSPLRSAQVLCLSSSKEFHPYPWNLLLHTPRTFLKQDIYPSKWILVNILFSNLLKFPVSEGKKGNTSSLYDFVKFSPRGKVQEKTKYVDYLPQNSPQYHRRSSLQASVSSIVLLWS